MIKTLFFNEIDAFEWQRLADHSPTASFFQTKECYDFYQKLAFLEGFLFGVSENGKLTGICCGYIVAEGNKLKQHFSRRAIVPGGLLLDANISDVALSTLLETIKKNLSKKAIYIEIRNYNDYSFVRQTVEGAGFTYKPHLNIQVSTIDTNSVFKKLSESKRRQLKQNEKADVICEESKNLEELKAFYKLLNQLYTKKIKKPIFPFVFFKELLTQPFSHFFVVKKEKQVLGGIVCVEYQSKVLYEWFICGDDRKKQRIYPSLAATWQAIKYATENNFDYFDFMGAGKPNKGYGVRNFKSRFGGDEVEYGRFLHICKPRLFVFVKKYLKFYKYIH